MFNKELRIQIRTAPCKIMKMDLVSTFNSSKLTKMYLSIKKIQPQTEVKNAVQSRYNIN